jgi:S1-C subfamily serine protease
VKRALLLLIALTALAGCVDPPPSGTRTVAANPAAISGESRHEALMRSMRRYIFRIRVVRCDEAGDATGWAYDKRTIITNRHVVEGAQRLEVETWDGYPLAVASAQEATNVDLGVIHLAQDAPAVAPKVAAKNAKDNSAVFFVGYAKGLAATAHAGTLENYGKGTALFDHEATMWMSTGGYPGDSGSPIVDPTGTVIGVIWGYHTQTGYLGGVPISDLRPVLPGRGLEPIVPCA